MSMPYVSIFILLIAILGADACHGSDYDAFSEEEETMLMFVGEDIESLSIASRREESAWQAPAIAQVISRKEMHKLGATTLAQALELTPGFHMAEKQWGTLPYLRGVSNSMLFLYDTVPTSADSNKSLHQLDYDLSLAPVKRIEIIRGPGSVLWGPDAFAGIVNVVPMTGRDLDGVETGLSYTSPLDAKGFYVNLGQGAPFWDMFLSLSGRKGREEDRIADLVRFWGDGDMAVPPEERMGHQLVDESRYIEVVGQFSYQDIFSLSGRITENKRPYTVSTEDTDATWLESKSTSSAFLKVESNKSLDLNSSLRFTGTYNTLRPEYEIIDRKLQVQEKTTYGEAIYNRSFLTGRGLLTGGTSYRNKKITNAPIWESYIPDFFGPENLNLLPLLIEEDYEDSLWSLFCQYTHQFGNLKAWLGLRHDDHDGYEDHFSFSSGMSYSPSSRWMTKVLYGTAYRTPFSRQLLVGKSPEMEMIESFSGQIAFKPTRRASLSLSAFSSRIENHIKEDPYAQLSLPNHQDIYGIEAEAKVTLTDRLDVTANLTRLANHGPDETFHFLSASFIRPDGTVVNIFEDVISPFDGGPDTLFNLIASWSPVDDLNLTAKVRYFSERKLIDPRREETKTADSAWLLDISATLANFATSGLDLRLSAQNVLDTRYQTPGAYEMIDGRALTVHLLLEKKW